MLLLLSLVVAAVNSLVLIVLLIVLVVNSISSSRGSNKILTWTDKYNLGVVVKAGKYKLGARAGKDKLGAKTGKCKLGARASKYKLGARANVRAKQRTEGQETQRLVYVTCLLYAVIDTRENLLVLTLLIYLAGIFPGMKFLFFQKDSNLLLLLNI